MRLRSTMAHPSDTLKFRGSSPPGGGSSFIFFFVCQIFFAFACRPNGLIFKIVVKFEGLDGHGKQCTRPLQFQPRVTRWAEGSNLGQHFKTLIPRKLCVRAKMFEFLVIVAMFGPRLIGGDHQCACRWDSFQEVWSKPEVVYFSDRT